MEFSQRERKTEKVFLVQLSIYRGRNIRRNVATCIMGRVPDPNPDPDPHVLGLPDLDRDPLVRCMDPDPDPSIIKQK